MRTPSSPPMRSSPSASHDRALRVSEARYRRLFETAQDGILLLNATTGQIEDVNPYLIKMLGYPYEDFLRKKLWEVGLFRDIADSKEAFETLQQKGYVRYEDLPLKTKAGAAINVEVVANSYDCDGIKVIQCNIRDITARTVAEAKARRHKALYVALSQCNQTIVHCKKAEELLPELCRIAVQLGGAKMAWVGMADTETGLVRPAASFGDTANYLKNITISVKDDTPLGHGPVGKALRENRSIWVQDIMHDPIMDPWRERIAPSGWVTSAALPLYRGGDVIGVFCVYSDKNTFFDEASRGLLSEMAMDVSFALDGFANESLRQKIEEALRTSESEFHTLAESMPQIVWIAGPDGGNTYFNQKWVEYTGLTLEESRGDGWIKPFHHDDQQRSWEAWKHATATAGIYSLECRLRRADGIYRWWLVRGMPLKDAAGNIVKWFGTCTDVHDLKMAEIKIRRLNRVHMLLSGINTLIVRTHNLDELFNEACRIAVELGGFRMSMMCLVDRSTKKISPVASAGKNAALLAMVEGIFSSPDGAQKTMCARAVREKTPVVANDILNDPQVLFATTYAEAGVASLAVFPVVISDEVEAVFALYAEERNFFGEEEEEEEMQLLTEVVGDIAFAIDHIRKGERLNYLAYYDELTGLANRSLFLERVGQFIRGKPRGQHKIAVLLIDLNRFKNINDSLGRLAGDALLKQVAEWLTQNRSDANLIARLDADHFCVVLPDVAPGRGLSQLIEQMLKALKEQQFGSRDSVLRMTATVGVAVFPNDGADAETLFRNAEAALNKAKTSGLRYMTYTAAMTKATEGKVSLENQLREAFEKGELVLYYQPKVSLTSGKVVGAEALIRWNDPRIGLVQPGQFIHSLEETGLIHDVGRWVIGAAVKDYVRWRDAGLTVVRIAVNVSPIQLRDPDFIADLEEIISIDAHSAAGLELEITEGVIMADISYNIGILRAIRALGITIAIDDFGTGFSSLAYLAKLPADTLKIDRSFISQMTNGPEELALVSTIINLAHGLRLKVVAEGVETGEQSRMLRLLACDEMQGFLFSKPIPGEDFESKYLNRAEG